MPSLVPWQVLILLSAFLFVFTSLTFPTASALADNATTTPQTASITIRDGDVTAFAGIVALAASTTSPVDIMPTNSSTTILVAADSLLATLVALDATTTDFEITDLAYFSSFDSFIINCIVTPDFFAESHCFNWTYAVNGVFPQIGIDDFLLEDGDVVHLFFGPPRKTVLSTTTVIVGESFIATAQHYDLNSGEYLPSPNLTLGVGIANPDFTFTELATSTSDSNGEAIFTLHATGTYSVGIAEDFYYPSASITILEATSSDNESEENEPPPTSGGGGGGGGGSGISHTQFDVPLALSYLSNAQESDGSFGASLYTDWVAIAFAAANPGDAKAKLRNYLEQATPVFSSVTDYERHAIALMTLGINPYSGTPVDYITPIVEAFDGTQIGNPSLDNDDIFALFPLLNAGYSASDTIIQKTAEFILSRQGINGSWDESPDMTAAAIQALGPLYMIPGINTALGRAVGYLGSTQQPDGGWGNIDSTSWVQTAINAINEAHPEPESAWTSSGGLYPSDAIASAQQSDGGVRDESELSGTRVWSTSYAVTAAAGKSWTTLIQSFPRPIASIDSSGGSTGDTSISTTTATSTNSGQATSTSLVLGQSTSTESVATGSVVAPIIEETQTAPRGTANYIDKTNFRFASESEADERINKEEKENPVNIETQSAAVANTPWFDNYLLWIIFLLLGLTALVVFLTYVRKHIAKN